MVKLWALALAPPEGLTRAGGPTSQVAPRHAGYWQEASVLLRPAPPQDCSVSSGHGSWLPPRDKVEAVESLVTYPWKSYTITPTVSY